MSVVRIAFYVFGLLLSLVVYTIVFASITLRAHGARALGWPALRNDPLFCVLLVLVVGGEVWVGSRWLVK
jgi:hypothetical protein